MVIDDQRVRVPDYTYRYYDPQIGRWPSRDPIEEMGEVNSYVFVENNASNAWDYLGRNMQTHSHMVLYIYYTCSCTLNTVCTKPGEAGNCQTCGDEGISVTGKGGSEDLVAAINFALANADAQAFDECQKKGAGCNPVDRAKADDCQCNPETRYRLEEGNEKLSNG